MMSDHPRGAIARIVDHSAFRYLLIGGASFAIDIGVLALLHEIFAWPLWLATGTSFLLSFVFNYSLQKSFSFSSRGQHLGTLVKYLILLAVNTLATIVIVDLISATVLGWGAGKVIATIVTTVWNYFIYRYWVFASNRAEPEAPAAGKPGVE